MQLSSKLAGFVTCCFLYAWEQQCCPLERDFEALSEPGTDGNRSKMVSITSAMF